MISIEQFIANFKKGFDEKYLENVFLNGNCFHFSLILNSVYDGDIIYNPHEQHFIFKHGTRYFDITGEVEKPFDEVYWEDFDEDDLEHENLMRECVYKV